jgi:hypothetical protein
MQATLRAKRRAVEARLLAESQRDRKEILLDHARKIVAAIAPHCRVELHDDFVMVLYGDREIGHQSLQRRIDTRSWGQLREVARRAAICTP